MKNYLILATLLTCMAAACNDQLLEQIQAIHTQNTELEKETSVLIESLVQIRNQINIQGRALTEEEIARVDEIDALEQRWLDWETSFQSIDPQKVAKKEGEAVLEKQQEFLLLIQALKADTEALLGKS